MLPNHSIKAIRLSKKENLSGLAPISIRVYINRQQRTYISTGKMIPAISWDETAGLVKKNFQNHSYLNSIIRNRISEIDALFLKADASKEKITIKKIRSLLMGGEPESFFDFAKEFIEDISIKKDSAGKGKYSSGTIVNYQNAINKLREYAGRDLMFGDITPKFLRQYETYLRERGISDTQKSVKGYENNTVHKHWKQLKKIFNVARKDSVTTHYPFGNYDNPKYEQTDRTFLVQSEIDAIEEVLKKPLDNHLRVAATYFLLGCYSGLRFSDWERFNPKFIMDKRLILRAKKNGEYVVFDIHHRLGKVIDEVLKLGRVGSEKVTNDNLKAVGRLAGIDKTLTTHVGRHTFGWRCAEFEIPPKVTAEWMGVTEKTVAIYYHLTNFNKKEDAAKWNTLSET